MLWFFSTAHLLAISKTAECLVFQCFFLIIFTVPLVCVQELQLSRAAPLKTIVALVIQELLPTVHVSVHILPTYVS